MPAAKSAANSVTAAERPQPSAGPWTPHAVRDPVLAALSALLLYMVCWIFMFPATSWNGWLPGHERLMTWLAEHDFVAAPRDIASKHGPHAAVKLTHILPSGVWCLCGAMQLAPPRLRAAAPRLHRLTGRVMLAAAVPVAIGYFVMEARGLVGGVHELHSVAPGSSSASSSSSSSGRGSSGGGTPDNHLALRCLNAWFVLTAAAALVQARRRRFASHGAWALRHIASGAWVVVQRLGVSAVSGVAMVAGVKWSEEARYDVFGKIAAASIVACVVGAEAYVRWGGGASLRPAAPVGGAAENESRREGEAAGGIGNGGAGPSSAAAEEQAAASARRRGPGRGNAGDQGQAVGPGAAAAARSTGSRRSSRTAGGRGGKAGDDKVE
ncbi:hypothetical protein HXX76_010198 [Chlamydomonas incerta]|uniref:Uncharacterized protein n=1 Tax=Chlamydomonas incerta TaxID=51695 RepID=A0A835SXJ6_CHLIN|nr:hypothetical protein HXX76_010198 [Chlamydomonas incerta]|eukprot:KAG2430099.1 hypothetical protein HXX76_010198 [Chlamydomonas incerta]